MDQRTFGRYEIKTELGRGGMGIVYDAFDPRFEREVALKVLPREMLRDVQSRIRFEREAKTIAMLEDPAIVPVYDFGEEDGQPYFVMRYMTGGSLSDRMRKGPMSIQDAAHILSRFAPTLDEAHAKGIIHRDLKPGNILFDQFNEPYISDFGIAKLFAAQTNVTGSAIIGTPAYMSPEQAQGENIDGRSDLYALGVILYEMVTGQQPYHGDTPMNVVVKQITEPVPHILDVKPDLPPDMEIVIEKAMAKDRNDRYSDVKSLASALNMVARGEKLSTPASELTVVPPSATVISSPGTMVASPQTVISSPGTVAAFPQTVIASKASSLTPPGGSFGNVPSLPESVPLKKSSLSRFLWIPISLIAVVCIFALVILVATLVFKQGGLAALPFLNTRTPTPTNTMVPTATILSTATPDYTAGTGVTGVLLYGGPGEHYPQVGFVFGDVKVIGQAYGCSWYRVVSTSDASSIGWASADKLTYKGKCSEVTAAEIPPTPLPLPTFTLIPTATNTLVPTSKPAGLPGPVANSCPIQSAMTIGNRTGAYADFKLVGPGTFYVSLPPDVNTSVPVCEGCYDVYILNGACGDASGTMVFRLCDGFNGWIYCN